MTVPKTNLFGERGEFDAVHVIVELLSPLHSSSCDRFAHFILKLLLLFLLSSIKQQQKFVILELLSPTTGHKVAQIAKVVNLVEVVINN